jgi:serine/threonine-protein kinase
MDRQLTCPQGHRWSTPAGGPGGAASQPSCPVCGAEPAGGDAPTTKFTLIPHYELLKRVGAGDLTVVFKARHTAMNRIVALRLLRSDDQAGPGAATRFRHEVQCLASLDHPNIVKAHEAGVANGLPYVAVEYLEGGSLARKLNGSPLPSREAARLLETLARAVHYLHGRRLIHRNLKPQGVLFAADGAPKLIDFGLARFIDPDAVSAEGAVVGTPSYMAPEQAEGRSGDIGPATDVYGLGAVLYECLTGRPPFREATAFNTLRAVVERPPVPPRTLNPQADPDLESICLKCLHKAPAKRYASALELADDLRRYLDRRPEAPRSS